MKALLLNRAEIRQLLPMRECLEVMSAVLTSLARAETVVPLRSIMWLPDSRGALGMMPAYLSKQQVMGLKALAIFPHNPCQEHDSHQGAVLLFEAQHGSLLAIMDAGAITAVRTAAVSGVATGLLAQGNAHDLAILGSGVQAATHLEAMMLTRRISRVRVWSRHFDRAQAFAERNSAEHNIRIEIVRAARDAVENADIICTVTSSKEPILLGQWLAAGAHVNAVGSSTPVARELDTEAVVRARLFVDRRESTLNEAGDFLIPRKEGAITDAHIQGEIGEVLTGEIRGRTTQEEITLFKSLGLAVEDVAAAHHLYQKATREGSGSWIEL
ncbi:MAG: ornithine cyclodeaminase family protein [bacterium]